MSGEWDLKKWTDNGSTYGGGMEKVLADGRVYKENCDSLRKLIKFRMTSRWEWEGKLSKKYISKWHFLSFLSRVSKFYQCVILSSCLLLPTKKYSTTQINTQNSLITISLDGVGGILSSKNYKLYTLQIGL